MCRWEDWTDGWFMFFFPFRIANVTNEHLMSSEKVPFAFFITPVTQHTIWRLSVFNFSKHILFYKFSSRIWHEHKMNFPPHVVLIWYIYIFFFLCTDFECESVLTLASYAHWPPPSFQMWHVNMLMKLSHLLHTHRHFITSEWKHADTQTRHGCAHWAAGLISCRTVICTRHIWPCTNAAPANQRGRSLRHCSSSQGKKLTRSVSTHPFRLTKRLVHERGLIISAVVRDLSMWGSGGDEPRRMER